MKSFESITSDPDLLDYFSEFDPEEVDRGWSLFQSAAVSALFNAIPDEGSVKGIVKEHSRQFHCQLVSDELFGWEGNCTCPEETHCRHLIATVLTALHPTAKAIRHTPAATRSKAATKQSGTPATQPDPSLLMSRFLESQKHKPDRPALRFVQRVQDLFRRVHLNDGHLLLGDLQDLGFSFAGYAWGRLELWPAPPASDYELWLYIAWAVREANMDLPDFMEPLTDLSLIASRMVRWQREKEVLEWRKRLEAASGIDYSQKVATHIDLRIVIHPRHAQLQWRNKATEPFKDFKITHSKRLTMDAADSGLSPSLFKPEASVLWTCCQDPYGNHARCELKYDDVHSGRMLNRVLRMSSLADRIVTASGQPLTRSTEPLRYALQHLPNGEENYRLNLVRVEGSPAPEILLALPGTPPLYLTAEGLFEGPPIHPFGPSPHIDIPDAALETQAGVNLITGLGVELPTRLAERTRRVSTRVKVYCDIKSSHPIGSREQVQVRVISETPGQPSERYGAGGWVPERDHPRKKASVSKNESLFVIDRSARGHIPRLMESLEAKWDQYRNLWEVRLTKNFPDHFIPWLASVPPEIEVLLDPELASLRRSHVSGTVRLEVQESGVDWFNLQVVLDVADTELTPEEIKLLLNAKGQYIRLGKKGWRRLQFHLSPDEEEQMSRIGLDAREFNAEPQRLHALQLSDKSAARLLPPQEVERIHRRADEIKTRVAPQTPASIQAELRPYQIEGFHFLAYLSSNHFGGVLADDMGLGKTLQTLTWLAWLHAETAGGKNTPQLPSLVVCPKSVMDNWESEAKRFLPGLRVLRWKGDDADALESARREADLIVINYPQLRSLSPGITKLTWLATILDEAQYIKNPDSQTAQVARALQSEHRLALTGTPIENRLLDLWSILAYAMPGALGNRSQFMRSFGSSEDPFARRRLAARVRPFLLRRTKGQVARDLPDRTEEDLHCELEGPQKTLYRAELKRAQQLLLKVQTKQQLNESRFNILTSLLRLRQICCHPALVDGTLTDADSAKVLALIDMLEPLMEEGHKVLVFSQFVGMLEILRDTLKRRDWAHYYLAGDTEDRGALVNEFQNATGSAVFLISLKAGGFGLNLTAASYVVLFDPWWNPAVESQAIDRTHRIGQTSKVIAYRLLIKDTIEEKIRALQKTKAALADDVFGDESFAKSLTLEDLRYLLSGEG